MKDERLPQGWKTWIARCLAEGYHPERLREKLISLGVSAQVAIDEVDEAIDHPYLIACQQLHEKLQRREWLLTSMHRAAKCAINKPYLSVPRIETPPYSVFLQEYYAASRPVILVDAINDWPVKTWTPEYLREQAGTTIVEVQFNRSDDPNYQANHNRHTAKMSLSKFIDDVIERSPSNDLYMTSNNRPMEMPGMQRLKDEYRNIGDGYLQDRKRGDLWLGPAGTITPIHHDLTNNLLIQIYGRKRVKLISPLQTPDMRNEFFVYSKIDLSAEGLNGKDLQHLDVCEVVLNPGEALFIPLAWWHHIESLDISISLTFMEFKDVPSDYHVKFPKPVHIKSP